MRLLSTLRDFFYAPILQTQQAALTIEHEAVNQQRERITRINHAWDIYRSGGNDPLRVVPGQPDDNTLINMCRVIVEKGADFLFGKPVEFDVIGDYEAEEAWLKDVWDANGREVLLHDIAINGGVTGDVFVKVINDKERPYPRLVNVDPGCVYAIWDPDDIEKVVEYRIEWVGISPSDGRSVARRQIIARNSGTWAILDYESRDRDAEYHEIGREVWPYPWCPLFQAKNLPAPNEFYGTPDLTSDIIHINDRLNFIASNTSKIIRHHAHPKTWGRGFNAQQIDMSPDNITIVNNTEGMLQNLEMNSDLQSSLNWYKYLQHALHTIARVPEVATGRVEGLGQLSGVALEILYGPIVDKTRTKRILYGQMLNDLNESLLELGGKGVDMKCRCKWSDPWPVDDLTQAQIAIIHQNIGVSRRTILTELGYDFDRERKQAEQDDDPEPNEEAEVATDEGGTRIADMRPSRTARKANTGVG